MAEVSFATKVVGQFTIRLDDERYVISGPKEYMESADYRRVCAQIAAGQDPCGAFRYSPDAMTALGVTLQTSYAGWRGLQTLGRDGRS